MISKGIRPNQDAVELFSRQQQEQEEGKQQAIKTKKACAFRDEVVLKVQMSKHFISTIKGSNLLRMFNTHTHSNYTPSTHTHTLSNTHKQCIRFINIPVHTNKQVFLNNGVRREPTTLTSGGGVRAWSRTCRKKKKSKYSHS